MLKGPYQKGRRDQMTPRWKEMVRERLASTGESHAALEARIKAGRGQIAKMLGDEQTSSVWVAKVAAALQLPMPGHENDDERALLESFRRASPEQKRALLELARAAALGDSGGSDN